MYFNVLFINSQYINQGVVTNGNINTTTYEDVCLQIMHTHKHIDANSGGDYEWNVIKYFELYALLSMEIN
jgi:hypothetical protein